jgi:hypothetical protein
VLFLFRAIHPSLRKLHTCFKWGRFSPNYFLNLSLVLGKISIKADTKIKDNSEIHLSM